MYIIFTLFRSHIRIYRVQVREEIWRVCLERTRPSITRGCRIDRSPFRKAQSLQRFRKRYRHISVTGGAEMGRTKKSTGHELRQVEPFVEILLRERHNAEGSGRAIRIQVCLRSGSALQHGVRYRRVLGDCRRRSSERYGTKSRGIWERDGGRERSYGFDEASRCRWVQRRSFRHVLQHRRR